MTLVAVSLAGVIRFSGVHRKPLPLPEWTPTPIPIATIAEVTPLLPRATPPKPRTTPHPQAGERFFTTPWIPTQRRHEFEARLGHATVVLCFWRDPAVLPYLNTLHRRYGSGVYFAGMPIGDDPDLIRKATYENDVVWRQHRNLPTNEEWLRERSLKPNDVLVLQAGTVRYSGPPGAALEAVLHVLGSAWGEDPIPREVRFALLYAGKPLVAGTTGEARLRLVDELTGAASTPESWIAGASELYAPAVPPGKYTAEVSIASSTGRAGDGWQRVTSLYVPDGPFPERRVLDLQHFIHMREPFDNAWVAPRPDAPPFYASPVTFRWDPVPDATQYRWTVFPTDVRPEVFGGETRETSVTITLPPGRAWDFFLTAKTAGPDVGTLRVMHDDIGDADQFRFRTQSAR